MNVLKGIDAGLVRVENSTIQDATNHGIVASKVRVEDSDIINAGVVHGGEGVVLINSTITGGSGAGIASGGTAKVIDSTITGKTGSGIAAGGVDIPIKVLGSDISSNGEKGIFAVIRNGRVTVRETTISNNAEEGIRSTGPVRVSRASVVTGNGLDGVDNGVGFAGDCERVTTRDSTVTGNAQNGSLCGASETCADIATCVEPDVRDTTCDTSFDTNSGVPGTNWGVCALD